jgi:predicted PurR-regulated permease PerM
MPEPRKSPLLRHPIAVGLVLTIGIGLLMAIGAAQVAFFLAFAAMLLASLMSFPVEWLSRWMPRGVAVLITVFLLLAIVAVLAAVSVRKLAAEGQGMIEHVSDAVARLQNWFEDHGQPADGNAGQAIASLRQRVDEWLANAAAKVVPAALTTVEAVFGAVVVLVLGAFIVHRPDVYRRGLLRLMPVKWEQRCAQVCDEEATALRRWIGGMLVSMTVMGALTGLGLWIAGIKVWLLLAVLTFFGTFVPYAGAIATAVPGLVMGLAQSSTHFFYALVVYLGVHIVEGYIVQPLIMKRAVHLQPALLLFWQSLIGAAFGVLGVMVATPLLVAVQVLVRLVYVEDYLGKEPEAAT